MPLYNIIYCNNYKKLRAFGGHLEGIWTKIALKPTISDFIQS
jgi:hypothetical protein